MTYFKYFIKKFINIFVKRFFWFILLFILIFILSITILPEKVFAVNVNDYYSELQQEIVINNLYRLTNYLIRDGKIDSNYKYFCAKENNNESLVVITKSNGQLYFETTPTSSGGEYGGIKFSYGACYYISNNVDYEDYQTFTSVWDKWNNGSVSGSTGTGTINKVVYSNINSNISGYTFIKPTLRPKFINPSITTTYSSITNWSFDYFNISGGSVLYALGYDYVLHYIYDGISYQININEFMHINNDGTFTFSIPRTSLLNNVYIDNGKNVVFSLYEYSPVSTTATIYSLDSYTLELTQEQVNIINNENEKNQQQELNNNINNINNSITDSNINDNITDDFSALGNGIDVPDISGVNGFFDIIYNAFCSDTIQSVSLTIPFVNKTFEINTENISAHFPAYMKYITGIFVWGIIGLYITMDIRTMIDELSKGKPENVGSDVKKEVL